MKPHEITDLCACLCLAISLPCAAHAALDVQSAANGGKGGCGADDGGRLVARKTMDPADFAHVKYNLLGRNYWTIMTAEYYSVPEWPERKPTDNPEVKKSFLFQDCGVYAYGGRGFPRNRGDAVTWPTIRENYCSADARDDAAWDRLDPKYKPGKPILAVCASKRNFEAMSGRIDLDFDDYAKFTNSHPRVYAFSTLAEFDNDSRMHYDRIRKMAPGPKKDLLEKEWGTTVATNRYERLRQLRQYFDRKVALYYGDLSKAMSERAAYSLEHVCAAWGVSIVAVETTGTTETSDYRWDVMGMFARGAARQFSIPWEWYIALHSCGYTKDLKEWSISGANYHHKQPSFHSPRGGLSASLMNRIHFYAYLNGANFVQPEGRTSFTWFDPKTGKEEFTPRGRDFERYHQFTHDHPGRGSTFAHCAILTPFAQGYPAFGGSPMIVCPYERFDNMVDGVFFTIVPPPKLNHKQLARIGVESNNLHNTSFAMSYDVLVPDSPQKPEEFLKVLTKYPVAYLTGMYQKDADIARPLTAYVERGGTLLLNALYLDRFPNGFAGVVWDGRTTFDCGARATDERGVSFDVKGEYDVADLKPAGVKTILADERGRILATAFRRGRGCVIVTAPLYMAPRWGDRKGYQVHEATEFGRVAFSFNEYFLRRFQDELYPVKVTGDCQYGINKTPSGWWLWILNNRGVSKFIDTFEKVDESCASRVRVDFKTVAAKSCVELQSGERVALSSGGFDATIPAGAIRIFELK